MAAEIKFPLGADQSVLVFKNENMNIPENTLKTLVGEGVVTTNEKEKEKFSLVVMLSQTPFSGESVGKALGLTLPGGKVVFVEPVGRKNPVELADEVLFGGGVDPRLEVSETEKVLVVSASKSKFEEGASSKIEAASSWTLGGDDLIEDDLIDEDNLLLEEDLSRPDTKTYDCGEGEGGVRKACKGCSCGLAEELDKEAEVTKKSAEKASSCGNCYLGDAFRCAACPYLGKPAFKPGEQVVLDL